MGETVLLYDISLYSGDTVFNVFHPEDFIEAVPVLESVTNENIVIGRHQDQYFHTFSSSVRNAGREIFWIHFAMFTRNASNKLELCVYYRWEPTITIEKSL